jgi:hypothetical protein
MIRSKHNWTRLNIRGNEWNSAVFCCRVRAQILGEVFGTLVIWGTPTKNQEIWEAIFLELCSWKILLVGQSRTIIRRWARENISCSGENMKFISSVVEQESCMYSIPHLWLNDGLKGKIALRSLIFANFNKNPRISQKTHKKIKPAKTSRRQILKNRDGLYK